MSTQAKPSTQAKRKLKSDTSRVMRVSGDNFAEFTRIKQAYAKKLKLPRATYDDIFEQALAVMRALIAGDELYIVSEKAFTDLAEARGEAIRQAVRAKQAPSWPAVCVRIGSDDGLAK